MKKAILTELTLVAIVLAISNVCANASDEETAGTAETSSAGDSLVVNALEPLSFQHIKIGGFWKQQAKLLTEKWLPHCAREMELGGKGQELLNLLETGKCLRGETAFCR